MGMPGHTQSSTISPALRQRLEHYNPRQQFDGPQYRVSALNLCVIFLPDLARSGSDTQYLATIPIGTPARNFSVIMDSGSGEFI